VSYVRRLAIIAGTAGLLAALASSVWAQAPRGLAGDSASAPVATRAMPRGTVLQASDVAGDPSAVLGFETQRVIAAGEALRAPAIAPAAAVRAGEAVTVRVELDGITVTRQGTSLGAARAGQPVRVRIGPHSMSGIAVAPGVVRLP
jgi:flagellar basal body P-ring formation protein FlgA